MRMLDRISLSRTRSGGRQVGGDRALGLRLLAGKLSAGWRFKADGRLSLLSLLSPSAFSRVHSRQCREGKAAKKTVDNDAPGIALPPATCLEGDAEDCGGCGCWLFWEEKRTEDWIEWISKCCPPQASFPPGGPGQGGYVPASLGLMAPRPLPRKPEPVLQQPNRRTHPTTLHTPQHSSMEPLVLFRQSWRTCAGAAAKGRRKLHCACGTQLLWYTMATLPRV
jgi:hypothetical protein